MKTTFISTSKASNLDENDETNYLIQKSNTVFNSQGVEKDHNINYQL